ncbi:MAG: pirin family protein [Paludibacter sp.]|nr:pirin family protein [Paludibacter sp.]
MNELRSIEKVMAPPAPHWVGNAFRVHNFFPGNLDMKRMSPFFLLDYGAKIEFPPSNIPRGVGVHPHRGFETVTIAYHGKVAHHDSAGHSGVIGEGDVQWMTAASGILHKEYHEEEWSKKGGLAQMAQIWVNLPAKYKMSEPKYQPLKHSDFNRFVFPDKTAEVEVIAGNFKDTKGIASTFTPIEMYNAYLKKGASVLFSFPKEYNTGFLIIEGTVMVNDKTVPADHFVLFANDGTDIQLSSGENAVVLVLSGEPINEPIVSYGPFVMNTKQEILQAYEDLDKGKFGFLE